MGFQRREFARPAVGAGEVLVRMSLATICGSDLHTFEGRREAPAPCVLGHEGVGVVESVGAGRSLDLVGKRVTWTLADSCGGCRPCVQWRLPQKCDSLFKYGHAALAEGSGLNGCYASHLLLRAGTRVVPVPPSLADELAGPVNCALATMVAVVEPLRERGGLVRRVLIQGGGLLGLYGVALLRERGVEEVWVVDPEEGRRALAEEFGAQVVSPEGLQAFAAGSFDVVIEVAGASVVVREGVRLLRPGGHYLWAGMVHDETRLDLLGVEVVKKCLTITGVHNYRPDHLEEAIEFLDGVRRAYPWGRLVSPPFPLTALREAFELAKSRVWHRVVVKTGEGV